MHKVRYYNLFAAIFQVVIAFFSAMNGFGRPSLKANISFHLAFASPYVYSIWWPIFALSIAYAIYMLASKTEKSKKQRERADELCRHTAIAFFLSSSWMVTAMYYQPDLVWPTLPIICGTYVFLFSAMRLATKTPCRYLSASYWCKVVPICLYAGWVGLAVFINIGSIVDAYGLTFLDLSTLQACSALILGAAILAGFALYYSRGEFSYAIALIWGLIGIYVGNFSDMNSRLVSDTALGMAIVSLILCFWFRRSKKA